MPHKRNGKLSLKSRTSTCNTKQCQAIKGLRNAITEPAGSNDPTSGMGDTSRGPQRWENNDPDSKRLSTSSMLVICCVVGLVAYGVFYRPA